MDVSDLQPGVDIDIPYIPDCDNLRGVTMLCVPGTVYRQVILSLTRDGVDGEQLRSRLASHQTRSHSKPLSASTIPLLFCPHFSMAAKKASKN